MPATPSPFQLPPPVVEVDAAAYARLATDLKRILGIDLSQYKPAQVWRRVNAFARANGIADTADLAGRAQRDAVLRERLRDMLTINVSEFFRNPEAWEALRERVLVPTIRKAGNLRAWSAGCSIGFEPYTLAILLKEMAPTGTSRILGTDIDMTALDRARKAIYPDLQMGGISPARKTRYFAKTDSGWEVRPEIRALVSYKRQDLLRDPFERGFDLVMCRNTVIYFTEAAKATLFQRLADSVKPGGTLFIGATETIANPRSLGLTPIASNLYQRVGA